MGLFLNELLDQLHEGKVGWVGQGEEPALLWWALLRCRSIEFQLASHTSIPIVLWSKWEANVLPDDARVMSVFEAFLNSLCKDSNIPILGIPSLFPLAPFLLLAFHYAF